MPYAVNGDIVPSGESICHRAEGILQIANAHPAISILERRVA